MAQLVKDLPHKHEDLSADIQQSHTKKIGFSGKHLQPHCVSREGGQAETSGPLEITGQSVGSDSSEGHCLKTQNSRKWVTIVEDA